MTGKVKRKRESWFSSPVELEIDSNPVWKSERDRFGISSAARERAREQRFVEELL